MSRILVVDARAGRAASLCRQLRRWGNVATTAGDGASALSLAAGFAPDAVVVAGMAACGRDELASGLRALPGAREALLIALEGLPGPGRLAPSGEYDLLFREPLNLLDLRRVLDCLVGQEG